MRKEGREVANIEEMAEILSRCDTIRLGIVDEGTPYIVPVSFGYELQAGRISVYFHGAKEGRRAGLLSAKPRVCVEADLCHGFPQNGRGGYTCDYESVIGWGTVETLDGSEAEKGIRLLMEHCGIPGEGCPENAMPITRVNRVVLDEITGKRRNLDDPNA